MWSNVRNMARIKKETVLFCLQRLLRPLVRFGLRNNLQVQDFLECIKAVLIDAAQASLSNEGERVTESRLSVMTGIHRRDVKRLIHADFKFDALQGLIMKVVGQWQTDHAFICEEEKPKLLSSGGEGSEFSQLVGKVSKDVNPATILFELERLGMVERDPRGLKLLQDTYTPSETFEEALTLASEDMEYLLAAVEENAFNRTRSEVLEEEDSISQQNIDQGGRELRILNLHARTEYDNVRVQALDEIRDWLIKEGHQLHRRARAFLARFDQDINPDPSYSERGAKVVLGTFSKVYEPDEE